MSQSKKMSVRYRQVGDGLWKATAIGPEGEEAASVTAESAVRAHSRLIKEVAKQEGEEFELESPGYLSEGDREEWKELNQRWKKKQEMLDLEIRGEQRMYFMRMMAKYGFKAEALASELHLSPPTVRNRLNGK